MISRCSKESHLVSYCKKSRYNAGQSKRLKPTVKAFSSYNSVINTEHFVSRIIEVFARNSAFF